MASPALRTNPIFFSSFHAMCFFLTLFVVGFAAPSDLRKAWMWDDRPGVAKMLNEVADSMAFTGFHDEAADLFER